MNPKALGAEFVGTFWLVLGGCGAAILAAARLAPEGGESVSYTHLTLPTTPYV